MRTHFAWNGMVCLIALSLTTASLKSEEVRIEQNGAPKPNTVFHRIELGESEWTSGFWAERQKVCREASLPQMWNIMVDDAHSQFLTNFLIAAGDKEGKHRGPAWNDGDFYKWIEAASAAFASNKDVQLEQHIDQAIAAIGRAQRPDGYVHTPVQIRRRQGDVTAVPFSEPLQFELYNFGHLMTAACVHTRATGKKGLLNIAVSAADFLDKTFNSPDSPLGRSAICPSHYMGLIELGRFVDNPRYIRLAQKLIERRDAVVDGTAHNESCATIGNILWNWRVLELTGEAKYADVLELALYNGLLATISLDGSSYFYTNTLRQLDRMPTDLRWSRQRQPFISCYCCPPNIVRTIAQTQLYAYGRSKDAIWVHLYGSSRLRTVDDHGSLIELVQETEYPSNGRIRIRIVETPKNEWALRLRIPRWAKEGSLKVNGVLSNAEFSPGTFASIQQAWKAGDQIEIDLQMPVRLLESHPLVEETRNQVAVRRGPLVYCLESTDLPPNGKVLNSFISNDAVFEPVSLGELPGVVVLRTKLAYRSTDVWVGELYRERANKPFESIDAQLGTDR